MPGLVGAIFRIGPLPLAGVLAIDGLARAGERRVTRIPGDTSVAGTGMVRGVHLLASEVRGGR